VLSLDNVVILKIMYQSHSNVEKFGLTGRRLDVMIEDNDVSSNPGHTFEKFSHVAETALG
jgi:hypothetical protein